MKRRCQICRKEVEVVVRSIEGLSIGLDPLSHSVLLDYSILLECPSCRTKLAQYDSSESADTQDRVDLVGAEFEWVSMSTRTSRDSISVEIVAHLRLVSGPATFELISHLSSSKFDIF